jgi:hypothetical protein
LNNLQTCTFKTNVDIFLHSNILFSALVGFSVVVNPLADFYTKYYIDVIAILWATTFSLLILFLPKVQAFYRSRRKEKDKMDKSQTSSKRKSLFPFHTGTMTSSQRPISLHDGTGELLSLEQILASENVFDQTRRRKTSASSLTPQAGNSNFIEVHEVNLLLFLEKKRRSSLYSCE